MFGLGAMEIVLILAAALIFIGPAKLPDVARTLGRSMREIRRTANDFSRELSFEEPPRRVKPKTPKEPEPDSEGEAEAEARPDTESEPDPDPYRDIAQEEAAEPAEPEAVLAEGAIPQAPQEPAGPDESERG